MKDREGQIQSWKYWKKKKKSKKQTNSLHTHKPKTKQNKNTCQTRIINSQNKFSKKKLHKDPTMNTKAKTISSYYTCPLKTFFKLQVSDASW